MWWQLFWWVVSFALSDYFRERLPAQTASGIGDFNVPTATEGRVVPIITGGTPKCRSPNCTWYGDFAAVERTVTTGVIFQEDEVIGFTYELSLQYALFKGQCAGITGIWIGDDQVFNHVDDNGGIPEPDFVDIDRDDLFGGVDGGGGFVGRIRLFNGSETQGVSGYLATRIAELPAYRGTCYVMITDETETKGANIGESPNLRFISVEVQAFDTVANGALGDVLNLGNDHHFIGPDANPVSVAYDLLTNPRWGRNFPPSDINLANFQSVAEIVFTEGIGYTQLIDEGTTTGEIQDTLEQHIDAYIGPNPVTGKFEIKLARFDYVLANEFQSGPNNIVAVKKWNKGDWSQTFNRVRLRYSDRAKNWNETHAVAIAAGNRIIQGGRTVTKESRYQGVHSANVANIIAARQLKSQSQPVSSGTIELDRTAYQLRPGDVFSFTSEKVNETDLAVRVTKAGVGNALRNTMEFEVIADIFDNELANVADPPDTEFIPPVQGVVPFAAADQAATESPFILMRLNPLPNLIPRISTLARRTGGAPQEYEVIRRISAGVPAGAYTSTDFVTAGFMQVGELRNAEQSWATGNGGFSMQVDGIGAASLDGLFGAYSPTNQNAAGIAVISPGLASEEWIAFDEIVDDLTGIRLENVWRACMDTQMKSHTAGERVWFIWTGGLGMGEETYGPDINVEMKFLPRSPNDAVLEPAATALPIVQIDGPETSGRNGKPLHPITLAVNAVNFPASADMGRLITQGASAGLPGMEMLPKQRAFNTQGIIASVMGLAFDGTGLNPSDIADLALELEAWLLNLDDDPTGDRAFAVANYSITAQTTAGDFFEFLLSDVIASGVQGFSFNGRIEIEITHSPDGQFPNQQNHEPMQFDLLVEGVFSVQENDVLMLSHFDGADLATVADDVSPWNGFLEFGGAAELDTAQSVFGGSSILLDGIDSYVRTPGRRDFDLADEWTVEFRVRWAVVGTSALFGQMDGSGADSWFLVWNDAGDQFQIQYTTNGVNGPFINALHTGTFLPVVDTWYAIRICKDPDDVFHTFVDGVQVGTANTVAASWFRSWSDITIGASWFVGVIGNPHDGWIDEIRFTPRCLSRSDYTVDTAAFTDARRNYPLLSHFEAADEATAYTDESLYGNVLNFGSLGTTKIATEQSAFGAASVEMGGTNAQGAACDGILVPFQPGQDLGKSNWTMQVRIRYRSLPSGATDGMALLSKYDRPATALMWFWVVNAAHTVTFSYTPTGVVSQQHVHTTAAQTIVIDTWYHFAAQRRGNDLELYFNGNRIAQVVDFFVATLGVLGPLNQPDNPNSVLGVGRIDASSVDSRQRAVDGWMDEVSFEHGVNLFNGSTYTIPAAATVDPIRNLAQNDFNDYLLLSGFENSDGFASDNVMQAEDLAGTSILFIGNAQIDTANSQFGTSSLLLDGSGDSIAFRFSMLRHNMRDRDFTIDCWADMDILPQDSGLGGLCLVSKWVNTGNERSWALYLDDTGASSDLVFAWSVDGTAVKRVFVLDYVPTINTQTHFQVVRSGSSMFLFVDGVLQTLDGASDSIGTDILHTNRIAIAVGVMTDTSSRNFDGHIDELRILGRAANTATFTPESVAYTRPVSPWY